MSQKSFSTQYNRPLELRVFGTLFLKVQLTSNASAAKKQGCMKKLVDKKVELFPKVFSLVKVRSTVKEKKKS